MQGAVEFKTEIELLSRVHHKNLVGLVGFCFEKGEQMLVYEHIPNGTLMDSLSSTFNSFTTPYIPCMLTKTKKLTIDIYPIKKNIHIVSDSNI